MGLNIIKPDQPMRTGPLMVVIYGSPGVGKTITCCTAGRTLLLDFDRGVLRSGVRRVKPPLPVDVVSPQKWEDVASITADDLRDYDAVVIDTVGRMQDMLAAWIMENFPKMESDRALTMAGFGKLRALAVEWISAIRQSSADLVVISHVEEEKREEEVKERLVVQGRLKSDLHAVAQAMGVLRIRNGQRVLEFDPTETALGKNPAGFAPIPVPAPDGENEQFRLFMRRILDEMRDKMNEYAGRDMAKTMGMEEFCEQLDVAVTDDALSGLVKAAISLGPVAKRMLFDKSKELGFKFDSASHMFVKAKKNGNGHG